MTLLVFLNGHNNFIYRDSRNHQKISGLPANFQAKLEKFSVLCSWMHSNDVYICYFLLIVFLESFDVSPHRRGKKLFIILQLLRINRAPMITYLFFLFDSNRFTCLWDFLLFLPTCTSLFNIKMSRATTIKESDVFSLTSRRVMLIWWTLILMLIYFCFCDSLL